MLFPVNFSSTFVSVPVPGSLFPVWGEEFGYLARPSDRVFTLSRLHMQL